MNRKSFFKNLLFGGLLTPAVLVKGDNKGNKGSREKTIHDQIEKAIRDTIIRELRPGGILGDQKHNYC